MQSSTSDLTGYFTHVYVTHSILLFLSQPVARELNTGRQNPEICICLRFRQTADLYHTAC